MTTCDKTTSVTELPTCDNVPNDSYLIVQGADTTCKVKLSDLVLGPDNLDFYPELTEIKNQLELLTAILESGSANWNNAHTVVQAKSASWDNISNYNLADMQDTLSAKGPDWDAAHTTVSSNSGNWDNTTDVLILSAEEWQRTADQVLTDDHYVKWDSAYALVVSLRSEGLESLISEGTAPWLTIYQTATSVFTTVYDNSGNWD